MRAALILVTIWLVMVWLARCGGDIGEEALFPADYATSFTEVRACRKSIDHSPHVRVFADAAAAGPYVTRDARFPVGAVIVKEDYADAGCTQLKSLAVMRREPAGYDPEVGDWHWQRVSPDGTVIDDGRVTGCRSCHIRCDPGPHGFDFTCAAP